MSRLQWNNVTAPDFTAAARLQESSNKALDDALTGVTDFVTGITTRQREADEQSLRIKAQSYMDNPEALRRDLASGAFYGNIKPGSLSNEFINSLTTAADGLLTSKNTFLKDQETKDYAALQAAANPILNQATMLQNQGRTEEARALLERPEVLALRNADFRQATLNRQTDGKNDRTERSEIQTLNEEREQAAVEAFLTQNSITDAGKAPLLRQMLEEKQISANVFNKLMSQYGAAPAGMSGGSTGGGGGDYGFIDFAETRDYVPKVLSAAGPMPQNLTNRQKAEWLRDAVIKTESAGDPNAVSSVGARGLMQIMPETAANPGMGVRPLQNDSPEENVRFGVDYLEALINRYDGNVEAALAAYNGGMKNADRWFNGRTPRDSTNLNALVQDDAANSFQSVAAGNQRYLDLQADPSDQNQAITAGMQEGGVLSGEGITRGMVTEAYREIEKLRPEGLSREELAKANWRMSPAMIVDILARSRSGAGGKPGWGGQIINGLFGSEAPRFSYDKAAAQELVNELYSSNAMAGAQAGRGINQARADAAQAQAALQAATQRVTQLEQAARGNPRLMQSQEMQQARMDVALAQAQLEAATQAIQGVITPTRTGDQVRAGNEMEARLAAEKAERERQAYLNNSRPRRTPRNNTSVETRERQRMQQYMQVGSPYSNLR